MKTTICLVVVGFLCGCNSLTYNERNTLQNLKAKGITVDKPLGGYEAPANPLAAGALNILPGIGNFYLAIGNAGDSSHYLYGLLNLLLWPISIVWGVPEAAIDANTINKRELIYYYTYNEDGKKTLQTRGISLDK